MRIAVVIPTFNRVTTTQAIIEQLLLQDTDQFEIIICDSGSSDGTAELGYTFPMIKLIHVGSDQWWTGATNAGISFARDMQFPLILLLNDDLTISYDLISKLLAYHEAYPNTLITPVQRELSGNFYAGTVIKGLFRQRENIRGIPKAVLKIDHSNGCCVLIPTKVFDAIGITDANNIPHVGGDLNIYLKSRNRGYQLIVVPDILIQHTSFTDYVDRFSIHNMLSHPGSVMHFKTYIYTGYALYNSWWKFIFLGIKNHLIYLRTIIKTWIRLAGFGK